MCAPKTSVQCIYEHSECAHFNIKNKQRVQKSALSTNPNLHPSFAQNFGLLKSANLCITSERRFMCIVQCSMHLYCALKTVHTKIFVHSVCTKRQLESVQNKILKNKHLIEICMFIKSVLKIINETTLFIIMNLCVNY